MDDPIMGMDDMWSRVIDETAESAHKFVIRKWRRVRTFVLTGQEVPRRCAAKTPYLYSVVDVALRQVVVTNRSECDVVPATDELKA